MYVYSRLSKENRRLRVEWNKWKDLRDQAYVGLFGFLVSQPVTSVLVSLESSEALPLALAP